MIKIMLGDFVAHSSVTDPGEYAAQINDLPTDMAELHKAINGFLIHIWKIRKSYPQLLRARPNEVFIRHNRNLIENAITLDDRPLSIARPMKKRSIVDCRHFATTLCMVLRHRGIPARARCGFATYLEKTHYEDHWGCEYWDARTNQWIMEDADKQLHQVSADHFITGARAWQMCRQDASKGNLFGFGAKMRGMWAARVNLVRDFASLNGFESISGDSWGLAYKDGSDLTAAELALLDEAATVASSDHRFDDMRALYNRNPELQMPAAVHNYDHVVTRQWRLVEWRQQK
jgi:hypothetical protein